MGGEAKKPGYWQEHISAWEASGLSAEMYSLEAGIGVGNLLYQSKRKQQKAGESKIQFIEQKKKPQIENASIGRLQLIFPNGIRIGIEGEPNSEWLGKIVQIVRGVSC
jgi:hypothetical protein